MKNPIFFVAVLCLLTSGNSQWMQANGPGGATINFMEKSTKAIFAVTERNGVFSSIDNGESWSLLHITGSQTDFIRAITSNGLTIYATNEDGQKIFRSTDNGGTWVKTCDRVGTGIFIRTLKANRNYLFALCSDTGVYRSSDSGVTWDVVNNGIDSIHSITSITMADDILFAGGSKHLASGLKHSVFRSLDDGTTWSPSDSGIPDKTSIYRFTVCGSRIIAITNTGYYISNDSGGNWKAYNPDFLGTGTSTAAPVYADNTFMYTEGDLLIAQINDSAGRVFLSTDKGSKWSAIGSTLPLHRMKNCMVNNNAIFIGTFKNGIFRSTDNGNNWVFANFGINVADVSSFAASSKSVFVSCFQTGVFVSVDNGTNWSNFTSGLVSGGASSIAIKDDLIFACCRGMGIFRSSVNKADWVKVSNLSLPTGYETYLAEYGGKLFALCDNGLYLSTDNGENWMLIGGSSIEIGAISVITACDSTVFVGGSAGLFYYNQGDYVLSKVVSGLASESISCLAGNGNLIFAGTEENGCFVSTDKGRNWQQTSLPYVTRPDGTPGGYDVARVSNLYISGKIVVASLPGPDLHVPNGGCYLSVDSGKCWTPLGPDTSWHNTITDLLIRGDTLLAGSFNKGVWMRTLPKESETVIGSSNPDLKSNLQLSLLLSERSGSGLSITYTLPQAVNASVSIHTLNGRQVVSLVNKKQPAGTYGYNWNSGKVAGLYIVRLKTKSQTISKRIMITPW
jgi:photosystem II stability/assembly factor-like uncharacterized protein